MSHQRSGGAAAVSQAVDVLRIDGSHANVAVDRLACEAALEVRLGDAPFSVIMRTPGDDAALALGFLFTEGVIASADDVLRVTAHPEDDTVVVDLAPALAAHLPALLAGRRQVTTTSSCGMCGRSSRESLDVERDVLVADWTLPSAMLTALPAKLRAAQAGFDETGGLHAAGLFDLEGRLEDVAEDVGRHNAVDKLIGRRLRDRRLPVGDRVLFVSGRSSFEIVQKAWLAGVKMIGAVSAPSSLAVSLADRAGITLLGFVRDGRANVYSHRSRIVAPGADLSAGDARRSS
jgi:FdhD protein